MQRQIRALASIVPAALLAAAASGQVLLIPDSGADKVWAFDPFDGSVISNNLIPNHPSLTQPINAIDSGRGTFLVTDETSDTVLEFNAFGGFIGTFADASDGIDGPNGLTLFEGKVYVASNVNGRIVRLDGDGSNATNWATNVGTPRDIAFRGNDALITESAGDDIVRYNLDGTFNSIWHNSDGASGIDFPQQIQIEPTGGALVAGFTPPLGLYTFDGNGNQVQAFTNLITSPRGVYRLGNGKILYAGGTRVRIYDPATQTEQDIVNVGGASFRYIEYSSIPTPGAAALGIVAGLVALRRRRA